MSDHQIATEVFCFFPKLVVGFLNLALFSTLASHLMRRAMIKRMLLCMIQPDLLDKFNFTDLPAIPLTVENMDKLKCLYHFTGTYQRKFYNRSTTYLVLLCGIYLLNTLILWFYITILQK